VEAVLVRRYFSENGEITFHWERLRKNRETKASGWGGPPVARGLAKKMHYKEHAGVDTPLFNHPDRKW